MKTFTLELVDLNPDVFEIVPAENPGSVPTGEPLIRQIRQIQAAVRNVRVDSGGYFIRPRLARRLTFVDSWTHRFERYLKQRFPSPFWIYRGGHHLAVHFGPPGTGSESITQPSAGPCLFRLIENSK